MSEYLKILKENPALEADFNQMISSLNKAGVEVGGELKSIFGWFAITGFYRGKITSSNERRAIDARWFKWQCIAFYPLAWLIAFELSSNVYLLELLK